MGRGKATYKAVREALEKLSERPACGPFRFFYKVEEVAEEAGCSKTTARKHLNHLTQFRGFERKSFGRTVGYRYVREYDN